MKKILITDDSQNWLTYHLNALKKYYGADAEIYSAPSARNAEQVITANIDMPFDIILTDMQMETDFMPLYAGEWLIREIQSYPQYKNTKIVIISAAPNIKEIASKYNVDYIPKSKCINDEVYKNII